MVIRHVGSEYLLDPHLAASDRPLDVVGSLTIRLTIVKETKSFLLPDARLAFDYRQSFIVADHREPPLRTWPLSVMASDGSVALSLVKEAAADSDALWWERVWRKPPGTYRVWCVSAIAGEIALGSLIGLVIAMVGFGLWLAVRLGVYGARAGARKCIACGYPIEPGSDCCPECGGLRPVWRSNALSANRRVPPGTSR
ncbi:MAG: hypothetical protein U0638_06665 [Phycisphaerales bacterium]